MLAKPTTQLVELDRAECLRLLAATNLGRLAVNAPEGLAPVIRPVNYVFDANSNSVVFRSAAGSKLARIVLSGHAAFEIDGVEPAGETGWSVIVIGVAEEVKHAPDVQRLEQMGLQPLAPGSKPHLIRIRANVVSGRRIAFVGSGSNS